MITFKDSRTSMTYPIKIQPGQLSSCRIHLGSSGRCGVLACSSALSRTYLNLSITIWGPLV